MTSLAWSGGKRCRWGHRTVLHTHGRNGQYHPHLHLLATSGGWDRHGHRWEHVEYLPYALLRRKWQWHVLTMVRQTLKSPAVQQLVDTCWRQYPRGLVTHVQKGAVPAQFHSVARYVAKYVVSPPMAVRRIDRYDGERVTYHYRSHRTDRVEHETVEVHTFIGRMVQHALPKGFKRIRYYGVQATKTFAKVKVVIHEALAKVQGVVKGAVKILARLTYRQRYERSTGCDPLQCPHCGQEMAVWRIWHPTYGVVYDEGQKIKRGTYSASAHELAPETGFRFEKPASWALCASRCARMRARPQRCCTSRAKTMVLPVPVGKTSKGRCTPRVAAASKAATASCWYGRGVRPVGGAMIAGIAHAPSAREGLQGVSGETSWASVESVPDSRPVCNLAKARCVQRGRCFPRREAGSQTLQHAGVAPECRIGLRQLVHLGFCAGIQQLLQEGHMVCHGRQHTFIRAAADAAHEPVELLGQLLLRRGHDVASSRLCPPATPQTE